METMAVLAEIETMSVSAVDLGALLGMAAQRVRNGGLITADEQAFDGYTDRGR